MVINIQYGECKQYLIFKWPLYLKKKMIKDFLICFFVLSFVQLQRLLELQEFCESLSSTEFPQIAMLALSTVEWESVQLVTSMLGHYAQLTTKMQRIEISLSDFFGGWAKIKFEITKYGEENLAQQLLSEMKTRESDLFNNQVLHAAIYLDPRYQLYIPQPNKENAVTFLSSLHKKLAFLKHENFNANLHAYDSNELDAFLNSIFDHVETEHKENNTTDSTNKDIKTILLEFNGNKELRSSSVFDYWRANKDLKPELYNLAVTVHSVPPTQTTVERSFSAMALILSPLRTRLSDKNLENLLLVRLNREIFCALFPFEALK